MKSRAYKVGEYIAQALLIMIAIPVVILFIKFIQWLIAL